VTLSTSGTGTVIQGNYIGTNAAGAAAVPNNIGVNVNASNVTIGGTAPNAGNLISGNRYANGGAGISSDVFSINNVLLSSGSSMTAQGNLIGTDAAGTGAIFNNTGIVLNAPSAHIGGTTTAARNIISGNSGQGIFIGTSFTGLASGANAVIEGNHIGLNPTGTAKLSNTGAGIAINALGITVGPGNVIAGNGVTPTNSSGVVVQPTGTASIFGNFIGTNASGAPRRQSQRCRAQFGEHSRGSAARNIISVWRKRHRVNANNGQDRIREPDPAELHRSGAGRRYPIGQQRRNQLQPGQRRQHRQLRRRQRDLGQHRQRHQHQHRRGGHDHRQRHRSQRGRRRGQAKHHQRDFDHRFLEQCHWRDDCADAERDRRQRH
jgi:hypothetical protein